MSAIPAAAPATIRRERATDHGRRKARIGLAILGVLVLVADPRAGARASRPRRDRSSRVLRGLSLSHPFGSDALGRDVLVAACSSRSASRSRSPWARSSLAFVDRHPARAARRLPRRLGRPRHHAARRPAAGAAGPAARDHPDRDRRPGQPHRAPRHRRHLHPDPRPRDPQLHARSRRRRRSSRRARARGSTSRRIVRPPRPAELDRPGAHPGERADGLRDADRGGAVVPGPRRAAADAVARA